MQKQDIIISGNGVIYKGEYRKIKVSGSTKVKEAIKADTINLMGNAKFYNDIEADVCTVHGSTQIDGNVKVKKMKINGSLNLKGNCQIGELVVNGNTSINGIINGEDITIRGNLILTKKCNIKSLKVYGGLESTNDVLGERIDIDGLVKCDGLISGEDINLHPLRHSYCREIGGSSITIKKPIYHILWLSFDKKSSFNCDLIEGDNIELEYVTSKIIRGENINLIKQCDIDKVEYSGTFLKGHECSLEEVVKVD